MINMISTNDTHKIPLSIPLTIIPHSSPSKSPIAPLM